MRKVFVGVALAGLLVLGAACTGETATQTDPIDLDPIEVVDDGTYSLSAAELVDAMPSSFISEFCYAYEGLAGHEDAALAAFLDGYGYGQDPSGEEVFFETASRC